MEKTKMENSKFYKNREKKKLYNSYLTKNLYRVLPMLSVDLFFQVFLAFPFSFIQFYLHILRLLIFEMD